MHDIKEAVQYIEVRCLKNYSFKGVWTLQAVDGVDLTIHAGDIFGIVGESGCGKSTLSKCMMRLTDLTDGQVLFTGKDISRQSCRTLRNDLQRMQMIFQNPYSSFNPKLKISYSLVEPCRLKGISRSQNKAIWISS